MLFPPSKSRVIKDRLRKYAGRNTLSSYKGNNRRALSLLPQPMIGSDIVVKGAVINVRSNVLLSLEANQKSGCLIIRSEKNKSRAGILMYRGRILGCMRGQKRTHDYVFGNQAYERTLEDLANASKTDIYDLKDELVAAAGALFHGKMHEQLNKPAKKSFEEELNKLVKSKLPGCLVITDKPATGTCIVYVFGGQIVGIHSRKEGWLKPKIDVVHKFISSCKNPRVQSCSMPCPDTDEFKQYSFSLSGLADRSLGSKAHSARYADTNRFSWQRLDEERLRDDQVKTQSTNKFTPRVGKNGQVISQKAKELDISPTYSVRP